jgi:hypothetical protein
MAAHLLGNSVTITASFPSVPSGVTFRARGTRGPGCVCVYGVAPEVTLVGGAYVFTLLLDPTWGPGQWAVQAIGAGAGAGGSALTLETTFSTAKSRFT